MNFMSAKKLYIYWNLQRCLEECSPYTQHEREGIGHHIVRRGEQVYIGDKGSSQNLPSHKCLGKHSKFLTINIQSHKQKRIKFKKWRASENRKGFLLKGELEGLERWIRDQEHLLLLQETHAQLPAPTWQPTAMWNFSPRDLMPSPGLLEHKAYT